MNTQRANLAAVRMWLDNYLAGAAGYAYIGSAVPLPDGGTDWAGGKAFPVDQVDDLAGYVDELDLAGRSGIYLRVTTVAAPPARGQRGGAGDSVSLPGMWADIDIAGPGHKHDPAKHNGLELPPDVDAARLIVAASGLPEPTLWQATGGGLYPWWLFDRPLDVRDETIREQAAAVSARLGKVLGHTARMLGYHYGTGIHDLARVLRVVGTVNRKANQERPSTALDSSGKRYPYSELAAAVLAGDVDEDQVEQAPAPARKAPVARPGMSPLDAFEEAATIADVLHPHGWTRTRVFPGGEEHWRRPGGTSLMSAKWNLNGVPVLIVHSSEAGLPDGSGQKLTLARTYAHLNRMTTTELSRALLAYAGGNPGAALPMLDNAPQIGAFIREACHVKEYDPAAGYSDRESFDSLVDSDPYADRTGDALTLKRQNGEAVPAAPAPPATAGQAPGVDDDQDQAPAAAAPLAEFADSTLAETVATRVFRGRFIWTGAGGWHRWTGKVWEECDIVEAVEQVRRFFRNWLIREIKTKTAEAGTDRMKALMGLQGAARINSVTALARGLIVRRYEDFDADADILNTQSGVIDFRTGETLPHDPAYLCTKITAVGYVAGASSELWDKALDALPADSRAWLQWRIGQALTGYMTPDDLLVVSHGGGQNGKSTVYGAINSVVGSYGRMVSDRVLLNSTDAHPTELMDLKGLRYAWIDETPEARKLDVARLKKTIGTSEITARHIRKDSVTFKAIHSFFVATNYRPIVAETDHGTWRRLALLTFPYKYVKRPEDIVDPQTHRLGDPRLRQHLVEAPRREAQEAVLAWIVEGAMKWYRAGRIMPDLPATVEQDTRHWREESDQILAYIGERLEFHQDYHIMSTELLGDFTNWIEEHGARAWSDKVLTSRFGDHDEVTARSVKKARIRHRAGLSRSSHVMPGWSGPNGTPGVALEPPAQYTAWIGIRFRSDNDEQPELAF